MKKLLAVILATIIISGLLTSLPVFAVSTDDDLPIITPTEIETTTVPDESTEPDTTEVEPSSEQTTTEPTTTEIETTTTVKLPEIKVKRISMKSYIHLKVGKKKTIKATVKPLNATNRMVNWKSSNPKVAKVDQKGTVTAKKAGACTIIATAKDGSKTKAKCFVVVGSIAKKIKLNKTKATIYTGDKLKLKVKFIKPQKVAYKGIKWTTSDNKIAKVNQKGKVTAIKKGKVTIKATTKDGSKKAVKCKVNVKNYDTKKLSVKELRSKKAVNRICEKLNNWYKKYGATIDPTLRKECGSWYYTSTNFYPLSNHTINELYIDTLDSWLHDMSGDYIKNGESWAEIKGYDYDAYHKWLDKLTPKLILDGNKNGWSDYFKYRTRIYCYPEKWTAPITGQTEYYIYFCNI